MITDVHYQRATIRHLQDIVREKDAAIAELVAALRHTLVVDGSRTCPDCIQARAVLVKYSK